jgi:integrase
VPIWTPEPLLRNRKTPAPPAKALGSRQYEGRLAIPEWRDTDLVFPNRLGSAMDHNNLYYREYIPLLANAGLNGKSFTFHTLRHTFATALFARGDHPKVVQSLLGHSFITQTMTPTPTSWKAQGGTPWTG